jgi:glycosyltransferase involved in cell wall biosynthesis
MDLSLVKSLSKRADLCYLIDLPSFALKSTFLEITIQQSGSAILEAKIYPEFSDYAHFIELSKTYVINRHSEKAYSLSNIRLQIALIKFIKKLNPDIIHCNNLLNLNFWPFLFQNRKPIILTDHDPFPHSGEESFKYSIIRKLNYRFIKKYILLNSVQMKEYLESYKFDVTNVFLSKLGVYTYLRDSYFVSAKSANNSILFFGRISRYKGLEYLIEAFNLAKKEIQDIKLTIAGAGDLKLSLLSDYNDAGITIINRYIPNKELITLISEAKFIVCPYTDATQSGVIMTAFALCKPVVATKVGGLVEMITDGYTGLLVPPRDSSALANAICYLLRDENLLARMSKNIEDIYYKGERSWDSITDKLIGIYRNVLSY